MRAAILAICLLCAAPSAAGAAVEQSFFGVQGWRLPDRFEMRSLERGGVGSLRVGFNRASVVHDGGHHWHELDELVGDAARSHIEVMPGGTTGARDLRPPHPRA